eukprot:12795037-Alexandrium_andersonii.AAC.1
MPRLAWGGTKHAWRATPKQPCSGYKLLTPGATTARIEFATRAAQIANAAVNRKKHCAAAPSHRGANSSIYGEMPRPSGEDRPRVLASLGPLSPSG